MSLAITVETGAPMSGLFGRSATVKVGDVAVFSEVVYDTDAEGNRTAEQAEKNVLNLFGSRLRRVLEEDA